MLRLDRILRDYRAAGSVADLLPFWGFVNDTNDATFLTKGGAVGQVFRLHGIDAECLDHADRRQVAHRMERALRALDESVRVYQYLVKRPAVLMPAGSHPNPVVEAALQRRAAHFAAKADALFDIDLYLVLLSERLARRQRRATDLGRDLAAARAHVHDVAQAFSAQLEDAVHPTRLSKEDAFTFFRHLVNYAPHKIDGIRLASDTHLDFFVSDSTIECHQDHLDVDGYAVKALTMKAAPAKTFAGMLHDLAAIPCALTACLEWRSISAATIRKMLRAGQRHHFQRRVSFVNYVSPETKPEEMLVDDSATALVRELGECLTALEVHGHVVGACSLTIVLHDRDGAKVEAAAADAIKVFAGHDGVLFEESYNLINTWLAVVPGNASYNVRKLPLLNTNVADLSLLFTEAAGQRTSPHLHGAPCLAVLETDHAAPYGWNLHVEDVGHTLIQGATGSGKSFLCNFFVLHAQQYDPYTVVFDLGGSYATLIRQLGGSVWKMGLSHREFTINPFCLEPTQDNLHFLFSFVRVLIQSSGQHALTLAEDRDLYEAVENVYTLDPPQRRLLTLSHLLPKSLADSLHRWVQGGPYAALFDNERDTLTFQRLQGFDFEGLDRFPLILEPVLFYVLYRASAAIQDEADSGLKLFVLDEAWRFARDPTVKAYMTDALKTWRKRNAAMVLATQRGEDFLDPDLLRTVIESCPTKVFLANPNLDQSRARDLFHLNHTEAALIERLIPHRQLLIKRPDGSKVVNLIVDAGTARLFAPTRSASSQSQSQSAQPARRTA